MDKVERKLKGLEEDFNNSWSTPTPLKEEIKQDVVNLVIIVVFFFLANSIAYIGYLFAVFLILSSIGATILNLKFLFRAFGNSKLPIILLRIILTIFILPIYIYATYYTIVNKLMT